jgi:hypothetical protein
MKDYYKTLMVHPEADTEIIKAAYRRLAQLYHPDVYKKDDAEERMKEINEAYEVLLDPEKREIYDREQRVPLTESMRTKHNRTTSGADEPSPGSSALFGRHADLLKIIALTFVISLVAGLLIKQGISIYRQQKMVTAGDLDNAKKLIEMGAQTILEERIKQKPRLLSMKDGEGRTLLRCSVEQGKTGIARSIIDRGVDVNDGTKKGYTPLHAAAYQGYLDMTELLITAGALVNAKTDRGHTPLHLAASRGNKEVAEYLISRGADVNSRDRAGESPLALAEKYGKDDLVKLLKIYGAQY